jgi:hypothetical protein
MQLGMYGPTQPAAGEPSNEVVALFESSMIIPTYLDG